MADDDERLVVLVEARVRDLERNMAKASGTVDTQFNRMRRSSKSATRQMEEDALRSTTRINQAMATVGTRIGDFGKAFASGLGISAVTLGVTGFVAAAKAAVESTAELGRQARMAGVDIEAFQELKFVAEQNRIGIDALTDGLKELNLRADEFIATGAGSGAEAFQRLGYSSEELAKKIKKPSDLFVEIIGRMKQFERAAQIRIGDEIFGGSAGERFVELVDQGAEGLREQIRLANDLGLVMNREMVQQAEEIDKKFNLITRTIGTRMKSAIVDAVSAWFRFMDSWRDFENQQKGTLELSLAGINGELDAARLKLKDLEQISLGTPADVMNIRMQREEIERLASRAEKVQGILDQRNTPATDGGGDTFTPKDTSTDYMRAYRDELAKSNRERQLATEMEKILADAASKGASLTREQAAALAEESVARSERDAAAKKSASESERNAKATEKEQKRINELIRDLETEIALVWASDRAKRAATASRQAGADATEKEREKIIALSEVLFQEQDARDKYQEKMMLYRDLTRAGLDDLFSGIEQGKGFWESMADVAVNSLKRIADTMLDDVLDSIFKVNNAAAGGGSGGGFFSTLFGGLFGSGAGVGKGTSNTSAWATGIDAFNAKGGVYGAATPFARGGAFTNSIVNKPTLFPFANGTGLMGEAGPEAIVPLSRDASGRLGVAVNGGQSANQDVHVTSDVKVSVDQNGNLQAYVTRVSQDQASRATAALAKQVPKMVDTRNQTRQTRGVRS